MNRSKLIRFVWPLTVVAAFAFGHLTSRRPVQSEESKTLVMASPASPSVDSLLDSSVPSGPQPEKASEDAVRGVGQPLSKKEIDALAQEAFRDSSELKRSLAFSKLLESLTPENAESILEAMRAFDVDGDEWDLFRYAWASVDPEAAIENAMSLEGRQRRDAISETVTGWASNDPEKAMAWVNALEDEDERRGYQENLVEGLADNDIGVATDYVLELASNGDERADNYLDIITREQLRNGDINSAVAWSENLPEGELRGEAMERVADRYVNEDPEAAARWAERYASVDYGADMIEEVSGEWAERDPESAVSWLQGLPAGRAQQEGMEQAIEEWADRDPTAASQFLVNMPNSPTKDAAVSGLVEEVVREDPHAAIAWAGTIGQEELRVETLTRTARDWYRRDEAAALAWLQTSGLPPEAQEAVVRRRDRD